MKILSYFINKILIYYLFISFLWIQIISDDIEFIFTLNELQIFELNSNYIIEKIKFSISTDNPYDYLFAILETSNYNTFLDSLPIGMIKETEISGLIDNEIIIKINFSLPYQFIRYNPLKSKGIYITEIKIYGHVYIIGENLDGKFFYTYKFAFNGNKYKKLCWAFIFRKIYQY